MFFDDRENSARAALRARQRTSKDKARMSGFGAERGSTPTSR
jgi:hypothetical protein